HAATTSNSSGQLNQPGQVDENKGAGFEMDSPNPTPSRLLRQSRLHFFQVPGLPPRPFQGAWMETKPSRLSRQALAKFAVDQQDAVSRLRSGGQGGRHRFIGQSAAAVEKSHFPAADQIAQ